MMRNRIRSALISAVVIGVSALVPATASATAEDSMLSIVNSQRSAAGCAPLRVDARLVRSATEHSVDMAVRNYFSHTTPEGVSFGDRIRRAGYPHPGAENIARGQRSVRQVMDEWLASPGHHHNIVNCRLNAVGFGIAVARDGRPVWTQDFGY